MSRQARILLVDDRAENLVALEAILAPLNQILVPVRSGKQAVQAVLDDEFAVVLLDIMMPGMDGFETATQIKRQAKDRDVPIIFLTAAAAQPEQAFRGYAAGAVDYLAKPFDPWVLQAKVSVFVDLYLKTASRFWTSCRSRWERSRSRSPCCAAARGDQGQRGGGDRGPASRAGRAAARRP